jgi:hypothetical protein
VRLNLTISWNLRKILEVRDYTPVIPALRKLKQEDHDFEVSLGYISESQSQRKEKKNAWKYTKLLLKHCTSY